MSRKAQFFVELYLEITESEQGQLTCEKACFIPVSLPLPSKQQNIANIQRAVHLSGFWARNTPALLQQMIEKYESEKNSSYNCFVKNKFNRNPIPAYTYPWRVYKGRERQTSSSGLLAGEDESIVLPSSSISN